MKWAIFDFGDNTFDIGQTSWIQGEDSKTFDNESWFFTNEVIVKWPKDFNAAKKKMLKNLDVDITETESERYPAKIVKFGDDYHSMDKCFDMYLKTGKAVTPHRGRGQRISVRNSKYNSESDKENDEEESSIHIARKPPPKKRKVMKDISKRKNSLLSLVKEKYKPTKFTSIDSDEESLDEVLSEQPNSLQLTRIETKMKELAGECGELKLQLKKLTSLMSSVAELPVIVKDLQASINGRLPINVRPCTPSQLKTAAHNPSSPLCLASDPTMTTTESDNADEEEQKLVKLAPGIEILPSQRELLSLHGNAKTYTYALMDMIWSRDVLATHSLTGKISYAHKTKDPKPSLDVAKVAALCDLVVKKFRQPDEKAVKGYIKAKLNNTERCRKTKNE